MGALAFNIFLIVVFGWAAVQTFHWREDVALFPRAVACLGLLMAGGQLLVELWRRRRPTQRAATGPAAVGMDAFVEIGGRGVVWLFSGFACALLLGIPVGVPLFVAVLTRYGFDEGWPLAIGVAAAAVFLILVVFGHIFGAMWADPLLFTLFS